MEEACTYLNKIMLPLGIDRFEKLRTGGFYYIDKTAFIEELLGTQFEVNLITRPRRFGKTLTMNMLHDFFDIRKDSRNLFKGLEIMDNTKLCAQWMNQYPVLFLTLKDVEDLTFADAYSQLEYVIASLCIEHDYLKDSEKVSNADRIAFLVPPPLPSPVNQLTFAFSPPVSHFPVFIRKTATRGTPRDTGVTHSLRSCLIFC